MRIPLPTPIRNLIYIEGVPPEIPPGFVESWGPKRVVGRSAFIRRFVIKATPCIFLFKLALKYLIGRDLDLLGVAFLLPMSFGLAWLLVTIHWNENEAMYTRAKLAELPPAQSARRSLEPLTDELETNS